MKQCNNQVCNGLKKPKYVSCIKINGIPILPPLITPVKRQELNHYKRNAIKVEKRLQREQEMRNYISNLYQTCSAEVLQNAVLNETHDAISYEDKQSQTQGNCELKNSPTCIDITNPNISQKVEDIEEHSDIIDQSDDIQNSVLITAQNNTTDTPECVLNTPRLIRSNSYILEKPSPMLAEYLKARDINKSPSHCWRSNTPTPRTDSVIEDCDTVSNIEPIVQSLKELKVTNIEDTESILNHPITSNDLQIVSVDTETPRTVQSETSITKDSKLCSLFTSEDCYDSSSTELELKCLSDCDSQIQDNISEFITNNVSPSESNHRNNSTLKPSCGPELNEILNKIPPEYSRQILDILERQQINSYLSDNFDEIQLHPEKYSTPHDTDIGETLYFSAIGNSGDMTNNNFNQNQGKNKMTMDKAATILSAAARGFLIRRLMKTEKVQNLIQTIRDALLCAVQLHNDTLDHIEEADVELHRRLIQQVSAACFAFHDVFFSTSIQDQMSFIAVDRQKKRERERRLSSARSNSSSKASRINASHKRIRQFSLHF